VPPPTMATAPLAPCVDGRHGQRHAGIGMYVVREHMIVLARCLEDRDRLRIRRRVATPTSVDTWRGRAAGS